MRIDRSPMTQSQQPITAMSQTATAPAAVNAEGAPARTTVKREALADSYTQARPPAPGTKPTATQTRPQTGAGSGAGATGKSQPGTVGKGRKDPLAEAQREYQQAKKDRAAHKPGSWNRMLQAHKNLAMQKRKQREYQAAQEELARTKNEAKKDGKIDEKEKHDIALSELLVILKRPG